MMQGAAAGDCVTSGLGAALGAVLVLSRAAGARIAAFTLETWAASAILAGACLLVLQLWLVAARLTAAAAVVLVLPGQPAATAAAVLTTSWAVTLTPLWIIDGALALALVLYLLFAEPASGCDEDADELRQARIKAFCALVLDAMFFATEVMLAQKLDAEARGAVAAAATPSWHAVVAPLYAASCVLAAFGALLFYHNAPAVDDGGVSGAFIV